MDKITKIEEKENLNIPVGSFKSIVSSLKKKPKFLISFGFIAFLIFLAIFADFIAPHDMRAINLDKHLTKPGLEYFFGADELGRDVFSRIIYGTRISLLIGIASVLLGLLIGGILGVLAGYYKGKVDSIIMRICDVLLSIPSILLAIAIVASLGGGVVNLIIAIAIANIPSFARIIRSNIITVSEKQFIEAANALGASNFRIILKHLVPNIISAIIVQLTIGVASAILSAAGLGFIGLGVESSVAEWGAMISSGKSYIRTHPHLTIFPGFTIMLTILAFNILGDEIRNAIDPRSREK